MKNITLGIIGGGINSAAGEAHMNAIRMTGLFDVVGGCYSRSNQVLFDSGCKYGTPTFSSVTDLLGDAQPDRLVVLTPTPDHYPSVMQAIGVRVPVLCEKALAAGAETAGVLSTCARSMGVPLSVVFNYTFYPAVQMLRNMLAEGQLGAVSHIHIEMPQSGYLWARPQAWRLTDTGIYLDLGTHLHHMIWFLTGQHPVSVHALERNWAHDVGVIDYVSAQVSYESFQCHMWFSKCSAGNSNGLRVRVFGSKGSAEWFQREPDVLRFGDANNAGASTMVLEVANPRFKRGHPTGFVEALANLYEAWAEDPAHPVLTPAVAVEGLELMEAMRESARMKLEVVL